MYWSAKSSELVQEIRSSKPESRPFHQRCLLSIAATAEDSVRAKISCGGSVAPRDASFDLTQVGPVSVSDLGV